MGLAIVTGSGVRTGCTAASPRIIGVQSRRRMDPEMSTEPAGDEQEEPADGEQSREQPDLSPASSGQPGDLERAEPADEEHASSTGEAIRPRTVFPLDNSVLCRLTKEQH